VRYLDGRGVLRRLLQVVTSQGFTIDEVSTDTAGRHAGSQTDSEAQDGKPLVQVTLQVHGRQLVTDLAATLADIGEVDAVLVNDANAIDERLPLPARSRQRLFTAGRRDPDAGGGPQSCRTQRAGRPGSRSGAARPCSLTGQGM
jgi:hypothetical protein